MYWRKRGEKRSQGRAGQREGVEEEKMHREERYRVTTPQLTSLCKNNDSIRMLRQREILEKS